MGQRPLAVLALGFLVMTAGLDQASAACEAAPGSAYRTTKIRLGESLGGSNVNPRNGSGLPRRRLAYTVFPGSNSNPAWPVSGNDLDARAQALLSGVGAWSRVKSCMGARR